MIFLYEFKLYTVKLHFHLCLCVEIFQLLPWGRSCVTESNEVEGVFSDKGRYDKYYHAHRERGREHESEQEQSFAFDAPPPAVTMHLTLFNLSGRDLGLCTATSCILFESIGSFSQGLSCQRLEPGFSFPMTVPFLSFSASSFLPTNALPILKE